MSKHEQTYISTKQFNVHTTCLHNCSTVQCRIQFSFRSTHRVVTSFGQYVEDIALPSCCFMQLNPNPQSLQTRCWSCSERLLLLQASVVEPARYSAVAACGHLTVKEAGRWFRLVLLTRNADIRCAAGANHERHSHTILFEC